MPRSRPLDRSKPLEAFASDLRRLRDSAPPREYRTDIPEPGEGKKPQSSQIPEPFGVDQVVAKYGVGRSSVYAALSARRLPSVTVLRAMVLAWAPAGEAAMPDWMNRRREVEVALATSSSSPAAETPPARRSEKESAQRARPAALRPAPENTTLSSPDMSSSAAAPTAITNEVQELYRAAGSPPVRAISAAVLADSRSADISPETVRRVVAGTSARHTSVLSVVRALAEIGGYDATAAEEKARRLQDLEEPSDAQGSSTRPAVAEAAGVDLRGCVIYGLQLTSGDGQTVDLRHAVLHDAVVHARSADAAGDRQLATGNGRPHGRPTNASGDRQLAAGNGRPNRRPTNPPRHRQLTTENGPPNRRPTNPPPHRQLTTGRRGCRRLYRRHERKAEHFLAFAGIAAASSATAA